MGAEEGHRRAAAVAVSGDGGPQGRRAAAEDCALPGADGARQKTIRGLMIPAAFATIIADAR